ncbi:substrate-binding domain-containing protein [Agromyces albus]|uniref:substrate-binding domain-containing protein n=1 Tax=Agromyces albus TaxID=205332 RepID=UPI00277D8879|nr:substrate-binding domain-containing protein [Agromyces albus]MDQ0577214.1 DNA-binding LacI/PurR family transcriptional regulator [Agromyces albus]
MLDIRPTAVVDLGVLAPSQRAQLNAAGIRTIPSATQVMEAGEDQDPIDIQIGRVQVRELVRRGSRTIVYAALADDRLDPFGPPRLEGIRRELAEHRLPDAAEIRVPLDLAGAHAALAEVLVGAGDGPIGICCYNDDVAIAVIAALRRVGKTIPDDVSVIGVDRTDVGQLVSPRLTTVAIDMPSLMESFVSELTTIRDKSVSGQETPTTRVEATALVQLVRGETT